MKQKCIEHENLSPIIVTLMLSVLEKEISKECPHPTHGQALPVAMGDGRTFVVICKTGYTIAQPALFTCSDGEWVPEEPKCVPATDRK